MKNIFSAIGIVSIVTAIIYFCIVTPINSYQKLERENRSLQADYKDKCAEVDKVYENFYNAIRAHTDWETTKAIYSDSRFFESEGELKDKKLKLGYQNLQSYNRYYE